ncbi:MAG: GAF domain-containing protein, partial [Chloroflexi bacterium]|nr:GAF domain-containing protein [Chloroflexota bacterium]
MLEEVRKAWDTAKVVAEVTTLEDLDNTLHSVADGTRYALNCDIVTLYGYDEKKGDLNYPPVMVGVQYPARASQRSEFFEDYIVFKILMRGQPYIANDVSMDPLFKDTRFAADEQIASCVAIPLTVGPEKVGVMFVNYRSLHRFTESELINIELFANQAAVAIRNAQLYQAEQQRVKELSGLNSISKAIGLLTDIQQVYQQVNESIAQLAGAEMCAVLLYEALTEELVCQLPVHGVPDEIARHYRIPVNTNSPVGAVWTLQNHLILNNVPQ